MKKLSRFLLSCTFLSLVLTGCGKSEEESKVEPDGSVPVLSEYGNEVTYGVYPQTNINDASLIATLNAIENPEPIGWYRYEGSYYVKTKATPSSNYFKFDNGNPIVEGEEYWFKCEPIIWRVLKNDNGDYLVLSSKLLDASCYHTTKEDRTIGGKTIHASNYKYSYIRAWLNEFFCISAFALGDSYIQVTNVDNGEYESTPEKIFLLSHDEYENDPNYGYEWIYTECVTTDWARARGSHIRTDKEYKNNGHYWTRSLYSSNIVWTIAYNGRENQSEVDATHLSVRPAMTITLP